MPSKNVTKTPGKAPVARLSVWISSALVEKVKLLAFEQGVKPSTVVNNLLKDVRSLDVQNAAPEPEGIEKETVVYRLDPAIDQELRQLAFKLSETHSRLITLALQAAPEPRIQRDTL